MLTSITRLYDLIIIKTKLALQHFHHSIPSSVPPKIAPFSFGDEPANYGESSSIQCNVMVGDYPISIDWQLNGMPVDDALVSIGKMGKRLSILNIDSVSGYHAGNYTCIASNLAGSVEHSSRLIVNGSDKEIMS